MSSNQSADESGQRTAAQFATTRWSVVLAAGHILPAAEPRVLSGPDAWGPMALADGRLILRDCTK